MALYCKKHAGDGIVNVLILRCCHDPCVKRPGFGALSDGTAFVCGIHRGDIVGSPAINFRALCKVAGCRKISKWGLGGKQPSDCPGHGPLEDGLVCTVAVGTAGSKLIPSSLFHNGPLIPRQAWVFVLRAFEVALKYFALSVYVIV